MKSLKLSALAVTLAASLVSASVFAQEESQQKIGVVNVQGIFQNIPQAATIQQAIATEFKDEIEVVNRMEKDLQYFIEKQRQYMDLIQQAIKTEFKDEIAAVNLKEKDLEFAMEKQRRETATMSAEEITQLEQQILTLREELAAKTQPLQQRMQQRSIEERNKNPEIKQLEQQIVPLRDEYAAKAQPLQQNVQRRTGEERNRLLAIIKQGITKVAEAEQYDVVLNATAVTYIKEEHDLSTKVIEELSKPVN